MYGEKNSILRKCILVHRDELCSIRFLTIHLWMKNIYSYHLPINSIVYMPTSSICWLRLCIIAME